MVATILLFASAFRVFNIANGLPELFPGFHPCKTSDGDCLLDNVKKGVEPFVNGISALKVKALDPVTYPKIDASTPNLKFILHDIVLSGLKSCKPLEAKNDVAKSQLYFVLECDLKLEGLYEINGKMLVFDIKGDGKLNVLLSKMVSKVTLNYIIKEGEDGKKYFRIKNFDHTYELKEKSHVAFEGLFKDNEVLAKATGDAIKSNPNEVVHEVGGPVIAACIKEIVENINRFLSKLPVDEITLDAA